MLHVLCTSLQNMSAGYTLYVRLQFVRRVFTNLAGGRPFYAPYYERVR